MHKAPIALSTFQKQSRKQFHNISTQGAEVEQLSRKPSTAYPERRIQAIVNCTCERDLVLRMNQSHGDLWASLRLSHAASARWQTHAQDGERDQHTPAGQQACWGGARRAGRFIDRLGTCALAAPVGVFPLTALWSGRHFRRRPARSFGAGGATAHTDSSCTGRLWHLGQMQRRTWQHWSIVVTTGTWGGIGHFLSAQGEDAPLGAS